MKYVCDVCGWEYDEEKGYPEGGIVWIWMVERTVGGGAGRDDPACGSAGHGGECKEKGWEKC